MSTLRLATWFYGVALLLLSATLTISMWAFLNDEDRFGPEGVEYALAIWAAPESTPMEQVSATIAQQSADLGVNVYKTWPSAEGGVRTTDYFVFEGDASRVVGDRATGKFPSFGGMYIGTLHASADLSRAQLYGSYAVQGSQSERDAIADALRSIGVDVTTSSVPNALLRWPLQVLAGPLGPAIVVAWLATFLAAVNLLTARMVIGATQVASGAGRGAVAARDASAVCAPAMLAGLLPTLVVVAYAGFWASGYRAATAISMTPPQFLFTLAAPLLAFGIQRIACRRLPLGKIVSGARPALLLVTLAATTALLTGVLATATAVGALSRSAHYAAERTLDTFWERNSELSVISLGYASVTADEAERNSALRAVYRAAAQRGKAFVARGNAFDGWGGPLDESPSAVVNSALVQAAGVLSGDQAQALAEHTVRRGAAALVIPAGLKADRGELTAQAQEWFAFQATLQGARSGGSADIALVEVPEVGLVPRLDTAVGDGAPLYLDSPVLLVVEEESGLVSDGFYALSGAYLDPAFIWTELEAAGADTWVTSLVPVSEVAALKAAEDRADLWTAMVGLFVMCFVLVVAWALAAAVYLARVRSRTFLMWTTGCSFLTIHRRFLVLACAGATVPAGTYLLLSDLAAPTRLAVLSGQALIALGAVTLSLILVGRQHNRIALLDS